jgi:hypothetical protein
MFGGFRIKSPKRLLLEVPAKKPGDEILGEGGRRRCAKRRTPQAAKFIAIQQNNKSEGGTSQSTLPGTMAELRPALANLLKKVLGARAAVQTMTLRFAQKAIIPISLQIKPSFRAAFTSLP